MLSVYRAAGSGEGGAEVNLTIQFPYRLRSCANLREHWAAKARRAKAERYMMALRLRGLPIPSFPVIVTLSWIHPRRADSDNVASAFKAVRDGVADWLGVDDGDESKVVWVYRQEVGQYAVRIEIKPRRARRTS
jgi:crossover junction endodeoxyribonuclease RusA